MQSITLYYSVKFVGIAAALSCNMLLLPVFIEYYISIVYM